MKNINTLEQLSEYINNNSVWPWDVEEIIERNGWINDCEDEYGVCHDANRNRVVINDFGEAESSKCNYSDIDITAKSGQ